MDRLQLCTNHVHSTAIEARLADSEAIRTKDLAGRWTELFNGADELSRSIRLCLKKSGLDGFVNLVDIPSDNLKRRLRVLSNPIVTPVTDEFPTEDKDEPKQKPEEEGKGKDKKELGRNGGKLTPVKSEVVINYAAKKNKKGSDRNISNPIVTPVSDEFPTEEEQKNVENKKDDAGKDPQVKPDGQRKS
ncbi:hypothetical protein Y032_0023g744 [Ancylostoma ceylanicum]|uniref:Uncharacterized protein n=1 Tax=Ancylostoma ceylanicum TaxID=53326 RepID=A0A016UWL9_9BILA|nr:hypothetical protein Y032_0023g744 [Ancylostoma ceylanicum]